MDFNQLILSPSDFGFHNIVKNKKKLYFLDFEYSGFDDPLKLLSDFYVIRIIRSPEKINNSLKKDSKIILL